MMVLLATKIGAHRDGEKELLNGAPIVTDQLWPEPNISTFAAGKAKTHHDVEVVDGSVLVLTLHNQYSFHSRGPGLQAANRSQDFLSTIRAFGD